MTKRISLPAFALAAALLAGCATTPVAPENQSAAVEAAQAETPIVIQQSTRSIEKTENNVEVEVHYVQFNVPSVDSQIEKFALDLLASQQPHLADIAIEMRKTQLEIAQNDAEREMAEHALTRFYLQCEPVQATPEAIDVLCIISEYSGGAHDSLSLQTFMFDPKTGAEIPPLSIIDPDETTALKKLSEISRTKLPEILAEQQSDEMMMPGTEPDAINFHNILRTPDGIRVYFEPYAVAPWAAGIVEMDL